MRKKIFFGLLITILLASCHHKRSIDGLVDAMENYGTYEEVYSGFSGYGILSKQWMRFQALQSQCTEADWLELCEHANPMIRGYAFRGLINKKSPQVFNVLLHHLRDTAEFERDYGCYDFPEPVTCHFLEMAGYMDYNVTSYKLSWNQRNEVDSILLFGDEIYEMKNWAGSGGGIKLYSREKMLKNILPQHRYHERLRKLATDGISEALIPLARYRDANDLAIFRKYFHDKGRRYNRNLLKAIALYQHVELLSFLEDRFGKGVVDFRAKLFDDVLPRYTRSSNEIPGDIDFWIKPIYPKIMIEPVVQSPDRL